ncbi:hypothetical protein SAMN04487907_1223 [Zunongwangia mangrovi]|uniref:Nucleotidyltransferase domain-containing protein n=1 Tax=Zunongwangia mangrovi TaxID=1334022 RepID=A0A1I1NBZ7_9FLAO|nr:nucleotidyltransferase [Zunongwangia mangrovi]SFC94886.1 hypothetical protein SAMN04487907_1223 [Zunongwangia mangrovi]
MSVLTYLTDLSKTITIPDWERNSTNTSITTLSYKLGNYFNKIESKFVFGSYDRKTILRRSRDSDSDVDFMVSFENGSSWTPQTLMNRLKRFAEANYSRNEIYQSSPTIVLELSHIKFELVPAYYTWGTYHIPAPASSFSQWTNTYPHALKKDLNDKNKANYYLIRKLVRLLKYWNVINYKVYTSYELEKYVIDKYYLASYNLKDYFYDAVAGLPTYGLSSYKEDKVLRLKRIVNEARENERQGWNYLAEEEIKKAFG